MDVEWDGRKAAANRKKHGVDFADAVTALHDEMALTIRDESTEQERFITTGTDALGRVLVLVHTWRKHRVRVISARKATARERRQYEG